MGNQKTRTGPYYATVHFPVGNVRGVGGMYSTRSLRRGQLVGPGEGTIYRTWSDAMAAAERYVQKNGGLAGTYSAR